MSYNFVTHSELKPQDASHAKILCNKDAVQQRCCATRPMCNKGLPFFCSGFALAADFVPETLQLHVAALSKLQHVRQLRRSTGSKQAAQQVRCHLNLVLHMQHNNCCLCQLVSQQHQSICICIDFHCSINEERTAGLGRKPASLCLTVQEVLSYQHGGPRMHHIPCKSRSTITSTV